MGRERQSGAGKGGVSEARQGGWGRGVAEPHLPRASVQVSKQSILLS